MGVCKKLQAGGPDLPIMSWVPRLKPTHRRDSINTSGMNINYMPGLCQVLADTHLFNTPSSPVSIWLFVPVPTKQCQTRVLCKRFMRELDKELDLEKERVKEVSKVGWKEASYTVVNAKIKVQQVPGGSLSQIGLF